MKMKLPFLKMVAAAGSLAVLSCTPSEMQRFSNGSENFGDVDPPTAEVLGNAWDPEALWYLVAMCGTLPTPCQVPPVTMPFLPGGAYTALRGVEVALFDPLNPTRPLLASAPTGAEGDWLVKGVPMRDDVPYFAVTTVPPGGPGPNPPPGPLPVAPPTRYQRTMDLKPIVTNHNICMGQPSAVLGDTGILQAVALHLTQSGTPTTVEDLSSPQRFGGVVVWWMMKPADAGTHVPASGTTMEASAGQVLNVGWAPPGALPPNIQSERGFFVENAPVSGQGIVVTLLPPNGGKPHSVQFTAKDPSTDAATGRPWSFPPLPPMQVGPGISFGELPAAAGGPPPPLFACIPRAH